MNSVNLLPATRRRHGIGGFGSPAFFGLSGALTLVLVATVLYVSAENRVSAGRAQLVHLSSGVAAWSTVAATYSGASAEAAQRMAALTDVQTLASTRFDWSNLLGQIASRMPADAQLSSLQAAAPVAATVTPTPVVTTATPAATTTATVAPATVSTAATSGSTIQLSACATSQSAVAATMVALQTVSGVSAVTLTSSTESGSTGGSASSTSSGGCALPVQFQLALAFSSPAASGTVAAAQTSASAPIASTGSAQ